MHHVQIILTLTLIQAHARLNHEHTTFGIISDFFAGKKKKRSPVKILRDKLFTETETREREGRRERLRDRQRQRQRQRQRH